MLCRVYAPTAAAPLLWLGLQKIARTPTPRLAINYRLSPWRDAPSYRPASEAKMPACRLSELGLNERPLGELRLLERLLAGGMTGETLPLLNRRLESQAHAAIGTSLDLLA